MKAKIEEKLLAIGVTGPGRDWVIKALDPATVGPAPGIPDCSANQVLRPEYNYRCTIQAPPGAGSWDAYLFFPPGDQNVVVWATAPSSTGSAPTSFGTRLPPAGAQTGVCVLQPNVVPSGYTNYVPYTGGSPINAAPRIPAYNVASMRSQYRSHTIELNAAAVSDQGEVYAGQFPCDIRSSRWQNWDVQTVSSGLYYLAGVVDYVPLPLSEAELTLSCRNAYVGRAKDGVYMPIRLSGPVQPFAPTPCETQLGTWNATPMSSSTMVTAAQGATVQWPHVLFACSNDTAGETALQPLNTSQSDTWVNSGYGNGEWCGDTGLDRCNVGVVIFRGLSGTSGPFPASLLIKSLIGLEAIPRPTSVDRVFSKTAAMFNPRALEAYYLLANELAPAFPASANALGGLLPILSSAASTLWPAVRSGLTGLRTGIADALSPYQTRPQPPATVTIRERVPARTPSVRAPSVASRVSRLSSGSRKRVTIKAKSRRVRKPRAQ